MKTFYSILSVMVAVVLLAPLAVADSGNTWDKKIDKPGRFKVLHRFNGEAVFDKETGLVWEQAPDSETDPGDRKDWFAAQAFCNQRSVGGRIGWRLPTVQELASLVDPTNPGGNPDLPAGDPFANVQSFEYWSATTFASNPTNAWEVDLGFGGAGFGTKNNTFFVWCVRGGHGGPDAQ